MTNFNNLYQWADDLSAVMSERKRDDIIQQINEAKNALAANTFTLAVLGKAKRGKSTLINAMLGRQDDTLAPIDKLPTSSAITRFRHGKSESATVFFQNGKSEAIPCSRIKDFVTEELNPSNKKEVALLEVTGQFPNLPSQVELVDTPGAGSLYEHHDTLLHAFIPQADAVIFLVTARMPLDEEELELLKEVKKADIDKIFFVINKIDESEADEIDAAVSHNRQQLAHCNITPEGFHKISAKYAYINKPESNVPELITDINRFLEEHKGAVIRKRFISKVSGIVASELRTIEVTYSSGTKSEAELDTDIAHLQKQKKELGSKREFQEKEFGRKWKESVEDFASQLGKAEKSITAEVTEKINNTGTVGVGKLVKELPTFLNKSIADVFTPITERFETAAQKACEGLDTEYPVLTNDDAGRIVFRSQRDMTAATGLIGGGALAATGIGVVSAGAATAATIAATNTAALAAAASAGASAASTASLLGGLGVLLDSASVFLIGVPIGGTLMGGAAASAGAGAVAAPTLLTTPLWVALAGPVGWTLAGVGVLAVPFAWRLSKLKQKDKLEDEARKQIEKIFKSIREDRIPALRKMGISILERFKNNLDYQIKELEDALNNAKANRPGKTELSTLKQQSERLNRIIAQSTEWINTTV